MKRIQLLLLFSSPLVARCFIEGEAARVPPYAMDESKEYFWHRNGTPISSSLDQRVHHEGRYLYFLPVHHNDSGVYRLTTNGSRPVYITVQVYDAKPFNRALLYTKTSDPAVNPIVYCPSEVQRLCQDFRGNFTWYKDFIQKLNGSEEGYRIFSASKEDEGIYTCRCTWMHMHKTFITSGSREFRIKDPGSVAYPPHFIFPTNGSVETGQLGSPKEMVCKVFFGYCLNGCEVRWKINGTFLQKNQLNNCRDNSFFEETSREIENETKRTIYKAVLTICKVTMEHFQTKFWCFAHTPNRWEEVTVSLKSSEAMYKHLIVHLNIMVALILTIVAFRVFMIDLALIFRDVFKMHVSQKDRKLYDAFVVYQTDNLGRAAEERIACFVSTVLPDMLERKCGYRLFICGRDDMPGEDCVEMVESRVKQSRRLMVLLTPPCTGQDGVSAPVAQDATSQLALHQALVQEEMKIILIELERMDGYSHLPRALQHLARKTTPLRWKETGCSSTRFWKHVRYLMPPAPTHRHVHPVLGATTDSDVKSTEPLNA